jgi:hypothetical protein
VPTQEQAFKPREDVEKIRADAERVDRYRYIANKDRTLMLAGTQSLNKRPVSPFSKLKETRGIVTSKRVADNFEVRNAMAQKEYSKSGYRYEQPQEYKFRDTDPGTCLNFG